MNARCIHQIEQVLGEVRQVVGNFRFIGEAMAEVINRQHAELLRQWNKIAHPGLGVAAAAVQ